MTDDPITITATVKAIGMLVGWVAITYGVVLWGRMNLSRYPIGIPFVYVTLGFGLLLVSNRAVLGPTRTALLLEAFGYIAIMGIATITFGWICAMQRAISEIVESDENPYAKYAPDEQLDVNGDADDGNGESEEAGDDSTE